MRRLTVGSAQVAPGWGFCSCRSSSLARHHPPWVLLWVLKNVPGGPLHGCPGVCRSHGPKGGSRPLPSHVTVAPEQKESQRRFWQPLPTLLTDFLPPTETSSSATSYNSEFSKRLLSTYICEPCIPLSFTQAALGKGGWLGLPRRGS